MARVRLGVNIDHVATLRQARQEGHPDVIAALRVCEKYGADGIVVHLREDRRHIQDKDVWLIRKAVKKHFNLEMSLASEIISIACRVRPDQVTLVPEKRQELTTEGGLDAIKNERRLKNAIQKFKAKKIKVSLFLDPKKSQLKKAADLGADAVEIHTGRYAQLRGEAQQKELSRIRLMAKYSAQLGLSVYAGHGLNYTNTKAIVKIKEIEEVNTGHSIIAYALFHGLPKAIRDMKKLCQR